MEERTEEKELNWSFIFHVFVKCVPGGTVVKNLPVSTGDTRDAGLIPGLGRCLGVGNDNSLQYSRLENSMNRGACCATVRGITQTRT